MASDVLADQKNPSVRLAPGRGVHGASERIERLAALEPGERRPDRGGFDGTRRQRPRPKPLQSREVFDAAQTAARAPADRALASQMRLQSFPGQRDAKPPGAAFDRLDLDSADLVGPFDDPLGEQEAIGEIFEIARRRHHDHERRAADDEFDRRLDRNGAGDRRAISAGVIGEPARLELRRRRAFTERHRPSPWRPAEGQGPPRGCGPASPTGCWSDGPARP